MSTRSTATSLHRLELIPVPLRMLVYGTAFLTFVLFCLPWAFSRLDLFFPVLHVEVGWLRWLGWGLFAASLSCYLASSYVLTTQGKGPFVEFDPPKELVIAGPYHYSRNPIVAFLLGSMLGEAIALSSTGIAFMFGIFALLCHLQVVKVEEPLLQQRFGQSYLDYCARVPRWIPLGSRQPLKQPSVESAASQQTLSESR